MRFVSGLACALSLVVFSSVAFADDTATPPAEQSTPPADQAEQAPPPNPEADKVICKRQPAETGTHLASREKICHTKREWDEMAEQGKAALQKAQDR